MPNPLVITFPQTNVSGIAISPSGYLPSGGYTTVKCQAVMNSGDIGNPGLILNFVIQDTPQWNNGQWHDWINLSWSGGMQNFNANNPSGAAPGFITGINLRDNRLYRSITYIPSGVILFIGGVITFT